MTEWLRDLPKAELHVHLEGSVTPETLCEIAPDLDPASVRARYGFDSFQEFLKTYGWVNGFFAGPKEFALIARRLFEAQSTQGVRYAEINLSVGVMLWRKLDPRPLIEAVLEAGSVAPFPVRWIFDAVRQFPVEQGWEVARLAAEYRSRGVVAFGIGGDEQRGPAGLFREVFQFAGDQGLRLAPHAGESAGPESVWAAIEMGAARIGHGIRAIDDPLLVRHLAERGIPLEICISSNIATGVVSRLEEHPVRRLFEAGVPIILNTDDPPMFGATLSGEYALAQSSFGFTAEELGGLAANSFRFAFDEAGVKAGSASQ